MYFMLVLPSYVAWHYGEAFTDILRVWTNYIWFFYNFFSLPNLAATLFSPWQRIEENKKKKGFHAEDMAEAAVTNLTMRLVGFCIRLIFIVIGTAVVLVVFWTGILFLLVWTLLPILIVSSFAYGIFKMI